MLIIAGETRSRHLIMSRERLEDFMTSQRLKKVFVKLERLMFDSMLRSKELTNCQKDYIFIPALSLQFNSLTQL
jgi:hypothetical protein